MPGRQFQHSTTADHRSRAERPGSGTCQSSMFLTWQIQPAPGHLAVAAQSGAVATAVVEAASRNGLGVANVVSLGNAADVSGNDLLLGWWHDDRVRVIAPLPGVTGQPAQVREDRPTRRGEPTRVGGQGWPVGRRPPGRAFTHRGRREHGRDGRRLVCPGECASHGRGRGAPGRGQVLDTQPLPAGGWIAVVGNAGGIGVLASDAALTAGLACRRSRKGCAVAGLRLGTFPSRAALRVGRRNAPHARPETTTTPNGRRARPGQPG
jgi:hypothetical protein